MIKIWISVTDHHKYFFKYFKFMVKINESRVFSNATSSTVINKFPIRSKAFESILVVRNIAQNFCWMQLSEPWVSLPTGFSKCSVDINPSIYKLNYLRTKLQCIIACYQTTPLLFRNKQSELTLTITSKIRHVTSGDQINLQGRSEGFVPTHCSSGENLAISCDWNKRTSGGHLLYWGPCPVGLCSGTFLGYKKIIKVLSITCKLH